MYKFHRTGLGLALVCSLAFAASGCFGGPPDTTGAKCTTNKDCNNGQTCVSGICKKTTGSGGGCKTNADCTSTQTCSSGSCVDNCHNIVCNTGQVCNNATRPGSCVQCVKDSQCSTGQTCDTTTNTCKSSGAQGPACKSIQDCARGDVCQSGYCQPAAYGDCSKLACATGLSCVTLTGASGTAQICLSPCTQTSDCPDPSTVCDTGSGDMAKGYCIDNVCNPSFPNQVQGPYNLQGASYNGPCNSAGTNDGTCWGPVGYQPAQQNSPAFAFGICIANGTAAPGAACDITASYSQPSKLCNAGFCNPSSATGTAGTCFADCTIADKSTCSNVNGNPTACIPYPGAELAGICWPQASNPAATGASCTPFSSAHQLTCVSDDTCAGAAGSATCVQLCDLKATTTTCTGGTTCQADANNDALLGNCK